MKQIDTRDIGKPDLSPIIHCQRCGERVYRRHQCRKCQRMVGRECCTLDYDVRGSIVTCHDCKAGKEPK